MSDADCNKRVLESLIKCGAFDSLGYKRSQLMEVYGQVLDGIAQQRRKNLEGQFDLFGGGGEDESSGIPELVLPNLPEYSRSQLMTMERETTGPVSYTHLYDGFILKAVSGLNSLRAEGNTIAAGSGVLLSRLASFAMEQGLSGLEFAHGIPGSLGGAVTMDAGAYEGDMSMVVREVRCLTEEGERETVSGRDLDFSYRHSAFSDERRFILGATLELKSGDSAAIKALMDDLWNRRRHKQPLDVPSAGSTFKRPKGYFAAALIDECKLKGVKMGGAQVLSLIHISPMTAER